MADDDLRYDLETPPEERRGSPLRPLLVGLLLLAIGVAATIWWMGRRSQRAVPTAPAVAAAPAAEERGEVPATTAPPSIPLPPLDASDGFVRERLTPLSSAPAWAAWLANDDLLRRAVAAAARIAAGKSPRDALGAISPQGAFAVRQRDGRLWIDPASYARYDRLVDAARTLDVAAAAPVWRLLGPLAELAWREQAPPDQPLGGTLVGAIDHLLAAPLPPEEVEVQLEEGLYRFADPALESLTPAQKHLLRLGRERAAIVQGKLRELRGALATS